MTFLIKTKKNLQQYNSIISLSTLAYPSPKKKGTKNGMSWNW